MLSGMLLSSLDIDGTFFSREACLKFLIFALVFIYDKKQVTF